MICRWSHVQQQDSISLHLSTWWCNPFRMPSTLMCSFIVTWVIFFQIIHKRHPIAHWRGGDMGCLWNSLLNETKWRLYASLNLPIISSDNGLSPGRHQAIIWTKDGILLISPSVKYSSKVYFQSRICIWKCLENGSHFISAPMRWAWSFYVGSCHVICSMVLTDCCWEIITGRLLLTDCYWQIITDKLLLADCYWQIVTDILLLTDCYWPIVTDKLLLADCNWQIVTGRLLLANCYWHIVTDRLLLADCYWQIVTGRL